MRAAKLGGKTLNRAWFRHDDIAEGGTLQLRLGTSPNTGWGTSAAAVPPSDSERSLAAFGCSPG